MSAGKGDTYRKVNIKRWSDNYESIKWKSKSKKVLDNGLDLIKLSKQNKGDTCKR